MADKCIKKSNLDKIDLKLLKLLMRDSRAPLTQIAKTLNLSREVATYRLNRLKNEGILLDFVAEIDISKLGYIGAAVFVNVKATKQEEFKKFLNLCSFVSWVAELSGIWSFGFSIIGRTNRELDEKFLLVYNKFKEEIIDHRFTLHRKSTFFYEKYFSHFSAVSLKAEAKKNRIGKFIDYKIDQKDKLLLKELSKNSRADCVALAKKISLTAPAAAQRIRHLEAGGYIEKYSLFVDVSELGLYQYSIFVVNKNPDERQKLINYLTHHTNVSFIAEYVGDQFIEFGLFVNNPYDLRNKLQEIEESFPSNRVIEISLFQKEFVSVGPPSCIFE